MLYEFIGTLGVTSAMNATGADPYGVPLVLFLLYKLVHPMTGAHFNPAVTIGVYINGWSKDVWAHQTIQAMNMIFAQIVGAIVGMEIWRAVLEDTTEAGEFVDDDIPFLSPSTPH